MIARSPQSLDNLEMAMVDAEAERLMAPRASINRERMTWEQAYRQALANLSRRLDGRDAFMAWTPPEEEPASGA